MTPPARLRTVAALRYLTPLREGGSLPGVVETDDLGTYVVKFRGAGQGRKALVAEVVVGETARALGLPVPDLVVVDLDPRLAPAEPDEEVQDLLRASAGANLGMDYLPGAFGFDPGADRVDPAWAARVLWLDALVHNADRSWRNPNLVVWHREPWLIDHGAALWFHHDWARASGAALRDYPQAAEHVLLPLAGPLPEAHAQLAPRLPDALAAAVDLVPEEWLADEPGFDGPQEVRTAYREILTDRVRTPQAWLEGVEVLRAARL